MNTPASSTSAAWVIENFENMQPGDYHPGTGFKGTSMDFLLLKNSQVRMSILSTNGFNVDGKVLVLRKGTLEIQLQGLYSDFGFWFANAIKGFTVHFFDMNDALIGTVTEPDHGGDEKQLKYQSPVAFSKVHIVVENDSMIIDSIEAKP